MREQDSRSYPVREDMRLQYAFWAWERATWVALALIVLLALSGLFAHGPLSRRTVKDAALSLTYERFQRVTSVARLTATTVDVELVLHRAAVAIRGDVVAERRPLPLDPFPQHGPERPV